MAEVVAPGLLSEPTTVQATRYQEAELAAEQILGKEKQNVVDSRWIWPSTDIKNMYKANIKNFFKIEKRHSKIRFMRKWDDFYRSDKYLDLSNVYRYL